MGIEQILFVLCIIVIFQLSPLLATNDDDSRLGGSTVKSTPGDLLPRHLPRMDSFDQFVREFEVQLKGKNQTVREGTVRQINRISSGTANATVALLPHVMDTESINRLLKLLRAYDQFDEDPDTVDGMPTYEMFVKNPDMNNRTEGMKILDADPSSLVQRGKLRSELSQILDPILENMITPFVRQYFPDRCGNIAPGRACTPCYSLIRRYRSGERQSHGMHRDGLSAVTVVISLSTYGVDYTGGLYVSTGYGQKKFLKLSAGDAVAHTPRLLHGVQVHGKERWSWILWYRDSVQCEDHSSEWFKDCASSGDVICQELHAGKEAGNVVAMNEAAALGGSGTAAVKMARAHLGLLLGVNNINVTEAARFYRMAIESHHPDGHYGLAQLYLSKKNPQKHLPMVVHLLEEAAKLGHSFSMFNLGVAHTFGYGMRNYAIDTNKAAEWFVASGIPEGFYAASWQAKSVGDSKREQEYDARARALGHYRIWRKEARARTGSGGAGGVDLNLPWPPAHDGRQPPIF